MTETLSSFRQRESVPSVPRPVSEADEVYGLLKTNFYDPDRIQRKPTAEETVATAADAPTRITRGGWDSIQCWMSMKLKDVGIDVFPETGGMRIIGFRQGSAAPHLGIKTGDLITEIDQVGVDTSRTASALIKCKNNITSGHGDHVRLDIDDGRKVVLVQTKCERKFAERLPTGRKDISAVRLEMFVKNSRADLLRILRRIQRKPLRGLVLDLRGNVGGLMSSCANVAALFLKNKDIFRISHLGKVEEASTKGPAPFKDLPLALVADGQTASASEALIAALQHHTGAPLVGQKTYGKGTIQAEHTLNLMKDSMLRVTVGHWWTPQNTSVHQAGIMPYLETDTRLSENPADPDQTIVAAADLLDYELNRK